MKSLTGKSLLGTLSPQTAGAQTGHVANSSSPAAATKVRQVIQVVIEKTVMTKGGRGQLTPIDLIAYFLTKVDLVA